MKENTIILTLFKSGFLLVLSVFMISCEKKTLDEYLENGLDGYWKSRMVNSEFIDELLIQRIAFHKENNKEFQIIYLLNDDAVNDTVLKYGLGLVYFPSNKAKDEENYIFYHSQPQIVERGSYKYIIDTIEPPSTTLDSLRIFLSSREKYTGVIGEVISLKNLELK